MNREVHVGVKFPRATRPLIYTLVEFNLAQDADGCQGNGSKDKRKAPTDQ